jgi:tetratricopeptide (TPR) repeat protein
MRSAEKNIQNGDKYYAEGEYKKAYKMYGRAVSKEPNNLIYIDKVKNTLNQIVPVTQEEALAFYDSYLTTLVHKSRYSPHDIESHLDVVNELYKAAHLSGNVNYWRRLKESAESAYDRVETDNPRRHELLVYVGLASLRIENASMTEVYDDTGNIRFPGEDEIEMVLESDPGNEVAWAALAFGRMAVYYRLNQEGQTKQAARNRRFADETMQKAIQVAGDSFDVIATYFREIALQKSRMYARKLANPQSVDEDQIAALDEKLQEAQEKLVSVFNPTIHGMRTAEIVGLLEKATDNGIEAAEKILVQHLKESPNDFGRRQLHAELLKNLGSYDEAESEAQFVIDAPQQTVSFECIEQFYLRPVAAQFLVEMNGIQAINSDNEEERLELLARAKENREVLLELVSNNTSNRMVIYSDGLIALAEKRYSDAAKLLEESIRLNPDANARLLRQSAIALAETGSEGLAIDRLSSAIEREPTNLTNYLLKARLELRISDMQSAKATLMLLPPKKREHEQVAELMDLIQLSQASVATMFTDPILALIAASEKATADGLKEEAITILLEEVMGGNTEDWRLMTALSNAYMSNDNKEDAIKWRKKAIELNPESQELKNQLIVIESDDRVESTVAIIKSKNLPEVEEAIAIASDLYLIGSTSRVESSRWERAGNRLEAEAAQELSEKALAESKKYQQIVKDLEGDISAILALEFNQALVNQDVQKAQQLITEFESESDDEVQIQGMKVNLHLLKAELARKSSNLVEYEKQTQSALDIAKKITEELPFSDDGWRMLGLVYDAIGMESDALKANEKAYQVAPKKMRNVRSYVGSLLATQKDSQRLLRVVRLAREQFPSNKQILSLWLDVENRYGLSEDVLAYRQNRFLVRPDDRENAINLARFYINTSPERKFILNVDGTTKYSKRAWDKMPKDAKQNLIFQERTEWSKLSQSILDELSNEVDEDIRLCLLHASALRDKGQLSEASSVWDTFIESRKGTGEYIGAVIAASDFLTKSERPEQALKLLMAARDKQSDQFEIDGTIGSVYYLLGRFEEATELFKKPVEATRDAVLHSRMIESLVLSGKFNEAEESLAKLAVTNPPYSTAMLNALIHRTKSEQLLALGDFSGGTEAINSYRNSLQTAIEADPNNLTPYFRLCASLLSEFSLTQEKALLEEALQIVDEGEKIGIATEEFAVIRADVLQADGQLDRAVDRLVTYVEENPDANNARQRLVEAYIDLDNLNRAISTIEEGIELDPSSSVWYQRLGFLHSRNSDDLIAAIKAYISALEHQPSASLLHRINILTRTNKELPNRELLSMAQSDISKLHPVGSTIEAKALVKLDRKRDGLIAMEKSWKDYHLAIKNKWIPPLSATNWFVDLYEIFKDNPEEGEQFALKLAGGSFSNPQKHGLANYYKLFGGSYIDKALNIISNTIESATLSDDLRPMFLNLKGGYLVEVGRFEESKNVFKQLVDEDGSAFVLNNYAYVVGVYLDDPENGLKIAKEAVKLAPREPSIIDTVAELYYLTEDYDKAAETLDFLLQVDSSNVRAMSKLAILYSEKLGQPERGIVFAERARGFSPKSAEVLDALGWSYYQTNRKVKAEDLIRRSLKQEDNLNAYIHLAQIVMDSQKYEEALGHLRMAQELAKDPQSRKRISALQDDIRNIQAAVSE